MSATKKNNFGCQKKSFYATKGLHIVLLYGDDELQQ